MLHPRLSVVVVLGFLSKPRNSTSIARKLKTIVYRAVRYLFCSSLFHPQAESKYCFDDHEMRKACVHYKVNNMNLNGERSLSFQGSL